jgi:hypothetical protein
MKKVLLLIISFVYLFIYTLSAQQLKPGFDKSECIELLKIGTKFGDSVYQAKIPINHSHIISISLICIWQRNFHLLRKYGGY